ncbi:MAG TPA: hypothetical protein VJV74_11680, partial [Terriglobia bacterium]|nr:hypothetical protein [Terriglobia bacterium]
QRLAYAAGFDLYLAEASGANSHRLATFKDSISALFWSPDGRTLRLSTQGRDRSAFEVWDVNADGRRLQRILQGPGRFHGGSWLSDGSCLFVCDGYFGPNNFIYILRGGRRFLERSASTPTRLASNGPVEFTWQVPSPDAKRIFAIGSQHRPELTRYDAEVGEFVPYLRGIPAYWASFSPDGRALAYLSLPQHALWRARPDGSEPVQLTFAPLEGDGFAWSPDGKQIALRARRQGQPWTIYLVPADGGAPRPLTPGTTDAGIPSWSPDGKRIVFGDWPSVEGVDNDRCAIHFVDPETGKLSDLPGSKSLCTSRWSPDGRYIAALTIRSRRLRLFDLRTREWRALNSPPVNNPTWSHDGRYLYFDSTEARRAIYRVRIADGEVERIASLEKTDTPGSSAWGSGLAPDDSPLVTRDLGFTEIYALNMQWP